MGENTVRFTSKCASNDEKAKNCNCPENVSTAAKTFNVMGIKKLWIKKIIYWKQYDGPFGAYPDIYLLINNFGLKSPVNWNYNYNQTRLIEWELNDTLSIPINNFNFSITTWDHDKIGKDEKKIVYFLDASNFNNWEGDTLTYYNNGGFKFITEIVN